MKRKVHVNLEERSYDIIIDGNAIESLTDFLSKTNYSKIFIITDENVANLHLKKLNEVLDKSTILKEVIIAKAGEKAKSFEILENFC